MKILGAHVVFHRLLRITSIWSVSAVLLCKRTQDAPMYAGYWGLIGGTLDDGEEPASVALREVEEELGIPRAELMLHFLCDVRVQRNANPSEIGDRYFAAPLDRGMDR